MPADVVRTAAKLHEPVDRTLKRLQRFVPVGLRIPEVDLSTVENLTVTEDDSIALSQNLQTHLPSVGDRVPPAHLFLISSHFGDPIAVVLSRLARFRPLGLKLPEIDVAAVNQFRKLSYEDLAVLSKHCDGRWPWLEGTITRSHVVRAAEAIYESHEETLQRLRRLACLGLTIPEGDLDTWEA